MRTDRLVDSQESSVAQDLEDLVSGEHPLCFPLVHMWVNLLVDDLGETNTSMGVCVC